MRIIVKYYCQLNSTTKVNLNTKQIMNKEIKPYVKSWNKGLCVVCLKPLKYFEKENMMCDSCDEETDNISKEQLEAEINKSNL